MNRLNICYTSVRPGTSGSVMESESSDFISEIQPYGVFQIKSIGNISAETFSYTAILNERNVFDWMDSLEKSEDNFTVTGKIIKDEKEKDYVVFHIEGPRFNPITIPRSCIDPYPKKPNKFFIRQYLLRKKVQELYLGKEQIQIKSETTKLNPTVQTTKTKPKKGSLDNFFK